VSDGIATVRMTGDLSRYGFGDELSSAC
jgi:hypothetical protein